MSTTRVFTGLVIKAHDTSYWVAFPDFACCISCGATIQAAAQNAKDALQTHIDGMVADGFRIPVPRSREDILRIDAEDAIAVIDVDVDIPAAEAQNNIHPLPRRSRRDFQF